MVTDKSETKEVINLINEFVDKIKKVYPESEVADIRVFAKFEIISSIINLRLKASYQEQRFKILQQTTVEREAEMETSYIQALETGNIMPPQDKLFQ